MPRSQLGVLADALSVFEARRALCESIIAWEESAHDGALEAELEVTAAHLRAHAAASCHTLRMRSEHHTRVLPCPPVQRKLGMRLRDRCGVAGTATADRRAC